MQAHGLRVASGQHQGCALALLRADRSEDVDRTRPLIVRGARPGASSGPAARDPVLLAHARLVLPPPPAPTAADFDPRPGSLSLRPKAGLHHSPDEVQSLAASRTSCSPPESLTRSGLKTPE